MFGQTTRFQGSQTWVYQQPILLDNGKWDAIYNSDGRQPNSGTINVNEKAKTFCITDESGESINARISKIEHVQEKDIDFGDVTRVIYRGTSLSTGHDTKLVFTKTKNNGTLVRWYTTRIINTGVIIQGKEVRFDDWECYQFKTLFLNTSIVK